MYVLIETLHLEIIWGQMLFYSFKNFLLSHSWEIVFSTTPWMSGHTKQDILWLPEWLIPSQTRKHTGIYRELFQSQKCYTLDRLLHYNKEALLHKQSDIPSAQPALYNQHWTLLSDVKLCSSNVMIVRTVKTMLNELSLEESSIFPHQIQYMLSKHKQKTCGNEQSTSFVNEQLLSNVWSIHHINRVDSIIN